MTEMQIWINQHHPSREVGSLKIVRLGIEMYELSSQNASSSTKW